MEYIKFLGLPEKIGAVIIVCFLVSQIVGELLELKGKVVPEVFKLRKIFVRRKAEKAETAKTLREVKQLLADVNGHYSADNISKRDSWMGWVNGRADVYDKSIEKLDKGLSDIAQALRDNTKMTEEMFVQSSRDRIIDFAAKVAAENVPVSREEFKRIFKVHGRYEKFLEERGKTNGEVSIAFRVINESYEKHLRERSFIEDVRGY